MLLHAHKLYTKNNINFDTGFCVVDSQLGKASMMGVCGVGAGLFSSLYSLYIQEEFGLTKLLPILGFIYVFTGVLSIIFGPLTGEEIVT